jgi:hypothetical protein
MIARHVITLGIVFLCACSAPRETAQGQRAPAQSAAATAQQAAVAAPPATKLEAFKPAAGSVVTLGYNELGNVSGVSVDVREVRDLKGADLRGLVVQVTQSEYREERAFVDADEIPELLKGIDALLEVKANPTAFDNFEVRYNTRGDLRVTAFNSGTGTPVKYSVDAGSVVKASAFMNADALRRIREMFVRAQAKLNGP